MKDKVIRAYDHLEEALLFVILTAMVAIIFIQVVMRYVFSNALSWSEELARYLYVWSTWVGVSYSARRGTHLRITMFRDSLSPKGRRGLEIIVTIIWILFGIFVLCLGIEAVSTIAAFGQLSSAMRIPMQFCYLSIPVGMGLMILRLLGSLITQIRNFGQSEEEKPA